MRFVSKQGHPQPRLQSEARSLNTTVKLPIQSVNKMVGFKWTNVEMINLGTKESEQLCLVISCTLPCEEATYGRG